LIDHKPPQLFSAALLTNSFQAISARTGATSTKSNRIFAASRPNGSLTRRIIYARFGEPVADDSSCRLFNEFPSSQFNIIPREHSMRSRSFLSYALLSLSFIALCSVKADASTEYRVTGPFVHDNLALYFLHGEADKGPVPLTLEEALMKGRVRVDETSNVNQLTIENLGDEEVFVQAGDIVKGGKQDRALIVSILLPPKSGKMPISAFCVEQGRWRPRGMEDASKFTSAGASLPSREAKLAMRAPVAPSSDGPVVGGHPRGDETSVRQQAMWADVAKVQDKLSRRVGAPVAAAESRSSLQLALENEKLEAARSAYVKALKSSGEKDSDIVGFVFAVNGKVNSADVYPSNGLFKKMWAKQLNASVTEAIGEREGVSAAAPKAEDVLAFLDEAEKGKSSVKQVNERVNVETRDAAGSLYFEAARPNGGFVHKNYLSK
jgi:hypothetical protein